MPIDSEVRDGVLVVTNNNPSRRNSIDLDAFADLDRAIAQANADPAIGAVIIVGAEGYFCSGGDVNGLRERVGEPDEAKRLEGINRLHAMIATIRSCPKPVIAAVEGGAAGAGVSRALACDLIVAANNAYFSVAYVKIGLTPDGGATAFLSQALPRQLVAEMCMTGNRVGVDRLHTFGLVNELTEPGKAFDRAMQVAEMLAKGPSRAISRIKELTDLGQSASLAEQLDNDHPRETLEALVANGGLDLAKTGDSE